MIETPPIGGVSWLCTDTITKLRLALIDCNYVMDPLNSVHRSILFPAA